MKTTEIIVSIYQAHKPGTPGKRGPEGLPEYIGLAGVSGLNSRPEFASLVSHIPAEIGEIIVDHEAGGLGSSPWRKRVTISLPDHIHTGNYSFAGCNFSGMYSDYNAKDGMGPCVDIYCAITQIVTGSNEEAIDAAIASGIILNTPTKNGGREEIPVKILSVSPIYGDKFPG